MSAKWLSKRDGVVEVDPDLAYPAILAELGVEKPDQFDLEVAHDFIKWDAARYGVESGAFKDGATREIHIGHGADDKPKQWAQRHHPEGKYGKYRKDHGAEAWRFIRAHAFERYRALRGVSPA